MKGLLAVFVFVATLTSVTPQAGTELDAKVSQLREQRAYSDAVRELQTLKAADPKTFTANNYDYLLGRLAEQDGEFAVAMSEFQAVVSRNSLLAPYAMRHLSQVARSTGNLMLERIYLMRIRLEYPNNVFAASAKKRLAENTFESGNYGETIRLLTSGDSSAKLNNAAKITPIALIRDDQAQLGEAYLHAGQVDKARDIFTALGTNIPNADQPDDAAETAAKALDLLDGGPDNFGKKAPDLAEDEHLRRAHIYQFNRDQANAKLHFDAIIARFPSGANVADSIFQIGRLFAQQGNYVEALKWFERVLEQYPDSAVAKDSLLQTASSYARVGKHKEAINRYQKFIEKYPTDEKLDRAYLNIVDIQRDQGSDHEALKWCAKTQEVFKGKVPEAVALFAEARIYMSKDDWQNALNDLERLRQFSDLGGTTPGGTSSAEIAFLKGYALEQLKRYAEAIDVYLAIPDGRNEYYGWRATERLNFMAKDPASDSFIAQKAGQLAAGLAAKDADTRRRNAQSLLRLTDKPDVREKALSVLKAAIKILPQYSTVPAFKETKLAISPDSAAAKLLALGLYDEAVPEIEAASPDPAKMTVDTAYAMAVNYLRADRGDRAVSFIEPIWKKVPADYPIELIPREQLELLYPAVFKDALLKYAPDRHVDPRLMLAVMRQESRFQPDVKSNAAARGLMQFIPATANIVTSELGRNNFRPDELYYPPTAVLFGSQYVADLFRSFPEQTDAVVASYNGGDDNMKRWLGRAKSSLPERYVSEIMFAQSKDYVYRVMANYRMYQYLYDEQLKVR